ncbi:hypothetical protein [Azospirillum sp. sgz301742]
MLRIWGAWHEYDATGRGSVPLGTPLARFTLDHDGPGWTWTGGGRLGVEDHRPGALAAAEVAITGTDGGYMRDGNAYAPLRWYRHRQGVEANFTQPPGGSRRTV